MDIQAWTPFQTSTGIFLTAWVTGEQENEDVFIFAVAQFPICSINFNYYEKGVHSMCCAVPCCAVRCMSKLCIFSIYSKGLDVICYVYIFKSKICSHWFAWWKLRPEICVLNVYKTSKAIYFPSARSWTRHSFYKEMFFFFRTDNSSENCFQNASCVSKTLAGWH